MDDLIHPSDYSPLRQADSEVQVSILASEVILQAEIWKYRTRIGNYAIAHVSQDPTQGDRLAEQSLHKAIRTVRESVLESSGLSQTSALVARGRVFFSFCCLQVCGEIERPSKHLGRCFKGLHVPNAPEAFMPAPPCAWKMQRMLRARRRISSTQGARRRFPQLETTTTRQPIQKSIRAASSICLFCLELDSATKPGVAHFHFAKTDTWLSPAVGRSLLNESLRPV